MVEADPTLAPKPAGLDPKGSLATKDNIVCVIMVVLATIMLSIRFFVLLYVQKNRPFIDDWLMLLSIVSILRLPWLA